MVWYDVNLYQLTVHGRYIYTGRISYDSGKNIDWISLLDGASKFRLLDLLTAIENYLIDKQQEWIQQNIITVHKYAASMASLNKLLDYCNQIMVSYFYKKIKNDGIFL